MAEQTTFRDVDDYDLSVSLSEDHVLLVVRPDDDLLVYDAETAIAIGEKLIELGRAVIAKREEAGE